MPLHRTAPAHPHTCIAQSIDPSTKQFAFHLGLSTPCPVPSTIETRGQIKHQHGTTIANSPVQTCPCLVLGSCFCFPLCSAQFNSTLPLLLYFLFFLFFIFSRNARKSVHITTSFFRLFTHYTHTDTRPLYVVVPPIHRRKIREKALTATRDNLVFITTATHTNHYITLFHLGLTTRAYREQGRAWIAYQIELDWTDV